MIHARQRVGVEGDVLDLLEHLGVEDVSVLEPHQYDQGLGAAILVLELAVKPGVWMIGREEIVELGSDLRLRCPIGHECRYGYKEDTNRRPVGNDESADSPGVAATACTCHQ